MRLIDADRLKRKFCGHCEDNGKCQEEFCFDLNIIDSMPTVEPEIIMCKDCKWFGEHGCAICIVDDTDKPTENDYCSFAERRTDG